MRENIAFFVKRFVFLWLNGDEHKRKIKYHEIAS